MIFGEDRDMNRITHELADYIKQNVNPTLVEVKTHVLNGYESIEVKPRIDKGGKYADVSITIDANHDYIGIHIGRGNFFDMSQSYNLQVKEYLLSLVIACVEGRAEETIRVRDDNIIKSRLKLILPFGDRIFHYSKGLLPFAGKKETITYEPYPS